MNKKPTNSLPDLVCPLCKKEVKKHEEHYTCESCERDYPIFFGIPDFRVEVENWLNYGEDQKIASELVEKYDNMSLHELYMYAQGIDNYSPEEYFEQRAHQALRMVHRSRERMSNLGLFNGADKKKYLEVGCGTGALLAVASESFQNVIGIDICMEGLVIAKKRFEEMELDIPLICGCVDCLPFRDNSFEFVASDDVIEHTNSAELMVSECTRVTMEEGCFFFTTPNRFTIGKEPHVFVWGVGYVPRQFAEKYVSLFTSKSYKFTRLLSVFEIRKMLNATGILDYQIILPDITKTELQDFSAVKRAFVQVYQFIKKLIIIRQILYLIGPFFQVVCIKKSPDLPP